MKRMKLIKLFLPVTSLALVGVLLVSLACQKKVVTNVPAGISQGVVQTWYSAAGDFQLAARYSKQLTDATIQLRADFPDQATYEKTLAALGAIDVIGIQASQFLETVPQNWNQPVASKVAGYLDQISAQMSIALDDGLLHVKNPQKLAALQTTISLLRGVVTTISALTKPAQGVN